MCTRLQASMDSHVNKSYIDDSTPQIVEIEKTAIEMNHANTLGVV